MQFSNPAAQVHVPDGVACDDAVTRTTHLAVGAHQDDLPIMAYHGILSCFARDDRWFLGVTVTDGAGSPRSARYADFTDDAMRVVRQEEEKKAATIGEYGAAVLLDYSSKKVRRDADTAALVSDLAGLIEAATPSVLYTHNLADKHDTHVAVALRVIEAVRSLPPARRPVEFYGCEVWRDLDWMNDDAKVAFNVSGHRNLATALMSVYDSQISGGKRIDAATAGRRTAHATFFDSHAVDIAEAMIFAMDLSPLLGDDSLDPLTLVDEHIARFRTDVANRIERASPAE